MPDEALPPHDSNRLGQPDWYVEDGLVVFTAPTM